MRVSTVDVHLCSRWPPRSNRWRDRRRSSLERTEVERNRTRFIETKIFEKERKKKRKTILTTRTDSLLVFYFCYLFFFVSKLDQITQNDNTTNVFPNFQFFIVVLRGQFKSTIPHFETMLLYKESYLRIVSFRYDRVPTMSFSIDKFVDFVQIDQNAIWLKKREQKACGYEQLDDS